MSAMEPPADNEDELDMDDTAEMPPVVDVQDDDSTPVPDQDPGQEDDS